MRTNRSLGISLALAAFSSAAGCYKLSSDCALNNNCDTGGDGGATITTTTPTGGTGGATTTPTGAAGGTTDSGGTGGTGGTTTPTESCDPSLNAGPVADDCGVFVSGTGDDASDGSKLSPLKTLKEAIARAAVAKRRVYACAGLYNEAVAVPPGISLHGGLQCETEWAYSKDARSTLQNIDSPNEIPLRLTPGSDPVYIANFTVQASDATLTSGSSIAMLADNAVAQIERSEFIAGKGQNGNGGVSSVWDAALVSALNGLDGVNACSGTTTGGAPVMSACGDFTSGQGGDGGNKSGANNGNGVDGGKGDGGDGGMGGNGQNAASQCSSGGLGTFGFDGASGDGGGSKLGVIGAVDATGYHGAPGQPGVDGTRGTSGGGGGGSKAVVSGCNGSAGGSGGAGGCGGKAGGGGTAGGASIAIVSLSSKLQLGEVHLVVSSGGNGGSGGNGQPGQFGGYGGHGGKGSSYNGSTLLKGCDGGDGGGGGKGGPGGGGAGGPTIGIAFTGAAPDVLPTIEFKGQPGLGGPGGILDVQKGGDGLSGVSAEKLAF